MPKKEVGRRGDGRARRGRAQSAVSALRSRNLYLGACLCPARLKRGEVVSDSLRKTAVLIAVPVCSMTASQRSIVEWPNVALLEATLGDIAHIEVTTCNVSSEYTARPHSLSSRHPFNTTTIVHSTRARDLCSASMEDSRRSPQLDFL